MSKICTICKGDVPEGVVVYNLPSRPDEYYCCESCYTYAIKTPPWKRKPASDWTAGDAGEWIAQLFQTALYPFKGVKLDARARHLTSQAVAGLREVIADALTGGRCPHLPHDCDIGIDPDTGDVKATFTIRTSS